MKNLKIILGVAIIAALMTIVFAACGDPEGEFTVTFDAKGGTPVEAITVNGGETIAEAPVSEKFDWTPSKAGLFPASQDVVWENGGKEFKFGSDKVTADITLTAKWTEPKDIATASLAPVSGSLIEKAVKYAGDKGGKFLLAINADVDTDTAKLDQDYADLRIVGLGGERKINMKGTTGRIFVVGAAGKKNIALTLGNNVTLNGKDSNNTSLILVQEGATVTMLANSKVTGNTSSGAGYVSWDNNHGFGVAGVHVDGATLIMSGGNISGNTNALEGTKNGTSTNNGYMVAKTLSAGGVFVEAAGTVNLQSGTINGNYNSGGTTDIFVTSGSSTLINTATFGGNVVVGEIGLGASSNGSTAKITLAADFSSTNVAKINLQGPTTAWTNDKKMIVQGANATTVQRFQLNKLLPASGTAAATDIGNSVKLGNDGKAGT